MSVEGYGVAGKVMLEMTVEDALIVSDILRAITPDHGVLDYLPEAFRVLRPAIDRAAWNAQRELPEEELTLELKAGESVVMRQPLEVVTLQSRLRGDREVLRYHYMPTQWAKEEPLEDLQRVYARLVVEVLPGPEAD